METPATPSPVRSPSRNEEEAIRHTQQGQHFLVSKDYIRAKSHFEAALQLFHKYSGSRDPNVSLSHEGLADSLLEINSASGSGDHYRTLAKGHYQEAISTFENNSIDSKEIREAKKRIQLKLTRLEQESSPASSPSRKWKGSAGYFSLNHNNTSDTRSLSSMDSEMSSNKLFRKGRLKKGGKKALKKFNALTHGKILHHMKEDEEDNGSLGSASANFQLPYQQETRPPISDLSITQQSSEGTPPRRSTPSTPPRASKHVVPFSRKYFDTMSEAEVSHNARVHYSLGKANLRSGEYAKGKDNLIKALKGSEYLRGPDHIGNATVREKLGDVSVKLTEYEVAQQHYDIALNISKSAHGDMNGKVAFILVKKGEAYLAAKENMQGLECLAEALAISREIDEGSNYDLINDILIKMGFVFLDQGNFKNTIKCFSEAEKNAALATITSKHNWAEIYYAMGLIYERMEEFEKALEKFALTLPLKMETLGYNHEEISTVHRHMGFIHFERKEYKKAFDSYAAAMEVMKRNRFKMEETVLVVDNMAAIYRHWKQIDKVILCYEELLDMINKSGADGDSVGVANILHKLGRVYIKTNQDAKAAKSYQKELDIREMEKHQTNPKQIAMIFIRLGTINWQSEDYDSALEKYSSSLVHLVPALIPRLVPKVGAVKKLTYEELQELLHFCEEGLKVQQKALLQATTAPVASFIPSRSMVSNMMNDMGNIYSMKGCYEEAVSCYETSLRIKVEKGNLHSMELIRCMVNLGVAYSNMKNHDQALATFESVLTEQKLKLGDDNLELACTLNHIGNSYLDKKDFPNALKFYEESFAIKQSKQEKDVSISKPIQIIDKDVNDVSTLWNIGKVFLKQGEYDKAITQYKKILTIQSRALGENNEEVGTAHHMIAITLSKKKMYREALVSYEQALKIRKDVFGGYHGKVGSTLYNMGVIQYELKMFDEAISTYRRSLHVKSTALGHFHPDIGRTLNQIARVHFAKKEYREARLLCDEALEIIVQAKLPEDHPYRNEVEKLSERINKILSKP